MNALQQPPIRLSRISETDPRRSFSTLSQ